MANFHLIPPLSSEGIEFDNLSFGYEFRGPDSTIIQQGSYPTAGTKYFNTESDLEQWIYFVKIVFINL